MTDSARYCYSVDGESYDGVFATRETAIQRARRVAKESKVIWTAKVLRGITVLRGRDFVDELLDRMEEELSEEIAADETILVLSLDDRAALNKMILDFVERHGTFEAYGVTEIEKHEVML